MSSRAFPAVTQQLYGSIKGNNDLLPVIVPLSKSELPELQHTMAKVLEQVLVLPFDMHGLLYFEANALPQHASGGPGIPWHPQPAKPSDMT